MNVNKIKVRKEKDTHWVKVTPEMADSLLSLNDEKNRKLSQVTVKKYAEDMFCGRWGKTNTNPIGVGLDADGKIVSLLDGQHRLAAVVMSGVSTWFEFAEVSEKNFQYLDQGKNRKVTDFIHEPNAKTLSSLALRILRTKRFDMGLTTIARKGGNAEKNIITQQMLLDYMHECEAEFPEWQECISQGQRLRKGIFKKGSLVMCSFFCWLLKWIGEDEHLENFIDDINTELSESVSVRLFKNFYQQMLVSGVTFAEDTFLMHLLWTYDHFYVCRYKKYPATKVSVVLDKYDILIKKKKEGQQIRWCEETLSNIKKDCDETLRKAKENQL